MFFKKIFRIKNLVLSKLDYLIDDHRLIQDKLDKLLIHTQNPSSFSFETESKQDLSNDPIANFQGDFYLRHNQRRQEHLATLNLPIYRKKILELGAGIGDHTTFFLDRGCELVTTEAREENLIFLRQRFPYIRVEQLDLENPWQNNTELFDIVYCYGLLYHLKNPTEAIEFMAKHCTKMLLLETCVSPGQDKAINLCEEVQENPTQSYSGTGCRPTRPWLLETLKRYFDYVYIPKTQPSHPEFPTDWTDSSLDDSTHLKRAIFIASRQELKNPLLLTELPDTQEQA